MLLETRVLHSGGSSPQYLTGHGSMASAVARAYNGVWGRAFDKGVGSKASLKLKHFWLLYVQRKPQI